MTNPETVGALLETPRISPEREQFLVETMHSGIDFDGVARDVEELKALYQPTNDDRLPDAWGIYEEAYRLNATSEAIDAHDELLLSNIRLIKSLIGDPSQGQIGHLDYDDRFAFAISAVSESLWGYTPSDDYQLSTRIIKAVQWGLPRALAAHAFSVRLPDGVVNQYKHYRRWLISNGLESHRVNADNLGGFATTRVLGSKAAIAAQQAGWMFWDSVSLDGDKRYKDYTDLDGQPTQRKTVSNRRDSVEDVQIQESFDEEFIWVEEAAVVSEALKLLRERDRNIVELSFGLVDGDSYNQTEIGEAIGLSRERVRQLLSRGLAELRHNPSVRGLRDLHVRRSDGQSPYKSPEYRMQQDMIKRIRLKDAIDPVDTVDSGQGTLEAKFETIRRAQEGLHAWGDLKEELGQGATEALARVAGIFGYSHGYPNVAEPAVREAVVHIAHKILPLVQHKQRLLNKRWATVREERPQLLDDIDETTAKIDRVCEEARKHLVALTE